MDGIGWVEQGRTFELGYGMVFVRGVEPMELVRRLDGELLSPEPMTWKDTAFYDEGYQSSQTIIRTGASGGWGFAVAEFGPVGPVGSDGDVVAMLSEGTEAVSYSRTVNRDTWFSFGRDGRAVCYFDPCLPVDWHVWPGPLAEQFIAAGLPSSGDMPEDAWERALAMGENVFGLDLPRADVAEGRLLAFQIH